MWTKIGHPVHDDKEFSLEHVEHLGNQYQKLHLKLPTPRTSLNSLFTLSVPPHAVVYLDDLRFLKPEDDLGGLDDGP